jgi:hypothetical protein
MRKHLGLAAAALLLAGCDGDITRIDDDIRNSTNPAVAIQQERLYDVTIVNLMTGQPLSPGVVVTHTAQADVYEVGQEASNGVKRIAEDGNPNPAAKELEGKPGFDHVMTFQKEIVPMNVPAPLDPAPRPANTSKVRVTARPGTDRLSVVTMLVCTNDGFTGVDAVQLPTGFDPVAFETQAYDARAEVNNEKFEFIVDGCTAAGPIKRPPNGNQFAPENGVIIPHPGIQGNADLRREAHGWEGPVVRIIVQRVRIE